LIVVDSAPVIPVSDVMVLMPEVEGALIVVKAGSTPREVVRRATELLQNAGGRILGVVMNNLEGVLPYYYNYTYYGYQYGHGDRKHGRTGRKNPPEQEPQAGLRNLSPLI